MTEQSSPIRAVLFDLDGTLVDTHEDLGLALNKTLEAHQQPALTMAEIRAQVSNGANALVALGFGPQLDDHRRLDLRQQLLEFYLADIATHSRPFDGILPLLEQVQQRQLPWGIVTNKPRRYTEALLANLKAPLTPAIVVCPEDVGVGKPDPKPLLYACARLGVAPQASVYIGDHKRDIEAAHNAGLKSIAVGYGFLSAKDDHRNWKAHYCAAAAADIWPILQSLV